MLNNTLSKAKQKKITTSLQDQSTVKDVSKSTDNTTSLKGEVTVIHPSSGLSPLTSTSTDHPVLPTSSAPTTSSSFSVPNYTHNENPPKVVPTEQHTLPCIKSLAPYPTSYSCSICSKHFGHRSSLYKHNKLCHPEQLNQGKIKCQENGCNFTSKQLSQHRQHLQTKREMKMFSNYEGNYTYIQPAYMYNFYVVCVTILYVLIISFRVYYLERAI